MKSLSIFIIIFFCFTSFSYSESSFEDTTKKEMEEFQNQFGKKTGLKNKKTQKTKRKSSKKFKHPQTIIDKDKFVIKEDFPEPVAEYLFNNNANDSSSNNNHAIVNFAVPTKDRKGNSNNAYIFYERDHKIKIPQTPENSFSTGSFTASFWIRTIDNNQFSERILSNENSSNTYWGFIYTTGGQINFTLKNQDNQTANILSPSVNDGKWHLITGIRTSENNTMSLYVDGNLIQTKTAVEGSVDGGNIWAGDHKNLLFIGRLDDIRLWNQALSEKSLAIIHSKNELTPVLAVKPLVVQPVNIPAPVAKYMFEGNTNDTSGNNNHGIATGAELTGDRFGNKKSAFLFYKRPHRIKIPLTPQNTFSEESFTVSFWVRPVGDNTVPKWLITNTSGAAPQWGFKYSDNNSIIFLLKNQEGQLSQISYPLNPKSWHHITGVRNAYNNSMSLYVNSNHAGSKPAVTGSINSLKDIWVGDHKNLLFTGRIDDVVLWDKPLNENNIKKFYNNAVINTQTASTEDSTEIQEPVGIYHFDGNTNDSSEMNNNAIVNNATLSQDRFGNADKAYCFSNRDHRIKIPLISENTFSDGSFTASFYIKINETTNTQLQVLTNTNGSNPNWAFTCHENGYISFSLRNKEKEYNVIRHSLNTGEWYKITGIRDTSNNTMSLYIGSDLIETRQGVPDDINSGESIWVGEHRNRLFKGCIDEVTLWNRALSASELQQSNSVNVQMNTPVINNKLIKNHDKRINTKRMK